MIALSIKQLENNQIEMELDGTDAQIGTLLAKAMSASDELAAIICSAIPTYLDSKNIPREAYCKTVVDAAGLRPGINNIQAN